MKMNNSVSFFLMLIFSIFSEAKVLKSSPTIVRVTSPVNSMGRVASFELKSSSSGTMPFHLGFGFKKGDIPAFAALDIPNSQVIILKKWNDGSAKHALISGHVALTANQPLTVNVLRSSTNSAGTAMTAAQISAANPSATVNLGGLGNVSLSSILNNPIRTFVSGPEMVEAHYKAALGNALVFFYVRLFKNGRVWVRTSVENGYVDKASSDLAHSANIAIGGVTVFSSASMTTPNHTRWTAEGWIGGDPQVFAKQDVTYLIQSRLVPNYMILGKANEVVMNGLYQNYKPNERGDWTANMGETGYQEQIGLLPLWDSLYLTSGGDQRAFNSVMANSKALGSYAIVWRGSLDGLPLKPSSFPTYSFSGPNQGGGNPPAPNGLQWEMAHHGSAGYLAYILTGDYFFLETMQHQSGNCFLSNGAAPGSGVNRKMVSQTRAAAWCFRTLGQLAGIAPLDSVTQDYAAILKSNADSLWSAALSAGSPLGFVYEYCPGSCFSSYSPSGSTSVFMHAFYVQAFGMVSDLEPLSDMTNWNNVRNRVYQIPVGLLGSGAAGTFCYSYASDYTVMLAAGATASISQTYKTWGEVFAATHPGVTTCGNSLLGSSGGGPTAASGGYWGNLLPAIAYAVDHGAPGAAASWARLTGATNWSTEILKSGFENVPIWGVVPRK